MRSSRVWAPDYCRRMIPLVGKEHGLHIPQGTYTVGLSWSVVLDNGYDKYTLLIPTLLSHSPSQGVLHCAAQGKPHSREPIYTAEYIRQ